MDQTAHASLSGLTITLMPSSLALTISIFQARFFRRLKFQVKSVNESAGIPTNPYQSDMPRSIPLAFRHESRPKESMGHGQWWPIFATTKQ